MEVYNYIGTILYTYQIIYISVDVIAVLSLYIVAFTTNAVLFFILK